MNEHPIKHCPFREFKRKGGESGAVYLVKVKDRCLDESWMCFHFLEISDVRIETKLSFYQEGVVITASLALELWNIFGLDRAQNGLII